MSVLPNVRTGAVAAIGPLEGIKTAVVEVIRGGGRYAIEGEKRAVEEPMRQS